jgi:DNA modification methylase
MNDRARTSTSNFGVGRREGHDASGFYGRFQPPDLSSDDEVTLAPDLGDGCFHGDAARMDQLPAKSVALVVTSPPYFVGKEYEEALGEGHVPSSYAAFLEMLTEVFEECRRVLEPGGRIAVNVANLGRKPYRSLSADVIGILESLGLLLRGEIIWQKGEGASGSCAWGSFRSAANPVLRDITERVIIASKGRFDRAKSPQQRKAEGFPFESTITSDEFMSNTLDLWRIEPESARRVNHPAPFPVELPEMLINLYTYRGDVVLEPLMGSGSTLVAAVKTGRRPVGYDLDLNYVQIAKDRVAAALKRRQEQEPLRKPGKKRRSLPACDAELDEQRAENFQARATQEGKTFQAIAKKVLEDSGFTITGENRRIPKTGVTVNFIALDADERPWYFDVTGAFTTTRGGLRRTDSVWKCLGRAHVLQNKVNGALKSDDKVPVVFLTSHLPKKGSEGEQAMRAAGPSAFFDAIEMLSPEGQTRLADYASGGHSTRPLAGYWSEKDISRFC